MNINWYPKQAPMQGLAGFAGGIASKMMGGSAPPGQELFNTEGSHTWSNPGTSSVSVFAVGAGGGGASSIGRGQVEVEVEQDIKITTQ